MAGKKQGARTPSQRQLKMGEVVRHALSDVFLRVDIEDEELTGVIVTATAVEISPDGRNANVFIIPLGRSDYDVIIPALNRHASFLRGEVSRRVEMKYTPALIFRADKSFDEGTHIDQILNSPKVRQDWESS